LASPRVLNAMTDFLCVFQTIVARPLLVPPAHASDPLPLAFTLPPVSFASDPWQLVSVPANVYFIVAGDGPSPGLILATPVSWQPRPCGPAAEDGTARAAVPIPRAVTAPAITTRRMNNPPA